VGKCPIDYQSCLSICEKKSYRSPLESTGVHWNPLESTGIHWNPIGVGGEGKVLLIYDNLDDVWSFSVELSPEGLIALLRVCGVY